MYCTCRVCGYDTVNIGSKIAARYRESIGEVNDAAIILEGPGTLEAWDARLPFLTPSICKSIHQMPGIPNIIHRKAFFASEPSGIHCRTRKYVVAMVMKKGNLRMKRKMCTGRYNPAGVEVTGKKGAIPDPRSRY